MWVGLIWLRFVSSGALLWTNLRLPRNADIVGLTELMPAVQRGLLGEFGYCYVQLQVWPCRCAVEVFGYCR